MTVSCDRAIQLFTYLKELSRLRITHIKDVAKYDEVLWFSDIPRERGCHCIAWELWAQRDEEDSGRGGAWVEVKKPTLKSPPELPDDLELWVSEEEVSDSSLDEPHVFDRITTVSDPDPETGEERTEVVSINNRPDIFEMWMDYVESEWRPWADEDKRFQDIQKIYNNLYTIYQRSEKLGEQYEVVVGLGFLLWRSERSGEIRHPLLTLHARVAFDGERGIISVVPSSDEAGINLEIDMLEAEDRPEVRDYQKIQEMVEELNGEPWHGTALDAILKSLANGISTESQYDSTLSRPDGISDIPKLHFAPSLILRRRTRRTFVDFYGRIIDQIEAGCVVPEGVRRLVEIVDDEGLDSERDPTEHPPDSLVSGDTELYFPLPANDEQKSIARRIDQCSGILVQGPPGTGKSQTIANLVAHFLAKGQRVLVTSETPRALEVLREKLPKEIGELCVLWLGSGPQAQESLEASVHGITQHKINWDPERAERDIVNLENRLDETRRTLAVLTREITARREAETYRHDGIFGDYNGTLERIAARVNQEREQFGWFLDRPDPEEEPLVGSEELLEMLRIDRQITEDRLQETKMLHLPMDCLISPTEFSELVVSEQQVSSLHKQAEMKRNYPGYESLRSLSSDRKATVLSLLQSLISHMDELAKHVHKWVDRAVREIVADQDRGWRHLLDVTLDHIHALAGKSGDVSGIHIVGLGNRDCSEVAHHARQLKAHLESGKGLGFMHPFRPKPVKQAWYLIKKITVEGRPCDSPTTLQRLLDWLEFRKRLEDLDELWKEYTRLPEGDFAIRLAAYEDLCEPLQDALSLHGVVGELKDFVSQLAELSSPRWHVRDDVEALCDAAEAIDIEERLTQAKKAFASLEKVVEGITQRSNAHPSARQTLEAIRNRNAIAYKEAYSLVSQTHDWIRVYNQKCDISRSFETSSPRTAAEYHASTSDESWDHRFADFLAAWNWSKTDSWLQQMCDEEKVKGLMTAVESSQAAEREALRELAAQKAWQYCMRELREAERQALVAWMQAAKRIRGGTGRHAERYRGEARQKLTECRKAIPAWIMPLYQVVQTINPQTGLFDVVIVDEASQSGPEALLLHFIGDKVIVVGDNKQIAPVYVGINRDDVTRLQQMYLQEIPHSDLFGLENSLFAQAELRFPDRVRLREHFRCMPEIIQFSNNLSYKTEPLIPLRQFGAERLEPCKTTHVADGYRTGRSPNIENKPEAKAIVEQIGQCLEDPAYEGKLLGVISLLGTAQTTLITKLLMQEVGAEEIEERKLLCGTPYDFQGNERDVIFLSMVDAPQDGRTCRMVRDEETQRRFNVAASRAKDQVWLFHSPTLNDLRTECLRYRLLEHCLNPRVEQTQVGDFELNELRQLAKSQARDRVDAPAPFDSWFEVDVFLRIAERGYRVLPQHEVADRRIDLVVEGLQRRLAVECHGDRWHGPERFSEDMERQRQLERCGWTFEIIWASQFYREPEEALQSLWDRLDKSEIYPKHQWEEVRRRREDTLADIVKDIAASEEEEVAGSTQPERSKDASGSGARAANSSREESGKPTKKQRPESLSARIIQQAIIAALGKCPNNSCTMKSIASRALKELGIKTRGNPRAEFEKRVRRNVGTLKRKNRVEEYKAKNRRLRLVPGSEQRSLL